MRRSTDENKEIKTLDKSEKLKEQMKAQKEEQSKNAIKTVETKTVTATKDPTKKKIVIKKINGRLKKKLAPLEKLPPQKTVEQEIKLDTPKVDLQTKAQDTTKQELRAANTFMANAALSAQGQSLTEEEKRIKDFMFNKPPKTVNDMLLKLDEESLSQFTLVLLKLSSADLNDFCNILGQRTAGFVFLNMVPQVRDTIMGRLKPVFKETIRYCMALKGIRRLNATPGRDDMDSLGYQRDSISANSAARRREIELNKYDDGYGMNNRFGNGGFGNNRFGNNSPWNRGGFGSMGNGFGWNNNRNGWNNNSGPNNGFGNYNNRNNPPDNKNDYEIRRLKDSLKDAEKKIDELKKAKDYPQTPIIPPPAQKTEDKNAIPQFDPNKFTNEVVRILEDKQTFNRRETTKLVNQFDSSAQLGKFYDLMTQYTKLFNETFGDRDVEKELGKSYNARPFDEFLKDNYDDGRNGDKYKTTQFDTNKNIFSTWLTLDKNRHIPDGTPVDQITRINRDIENVKNLRAICDEATNLLKILGTQNRQKMQMSDEIRKRQEETVSVKYKINEAIKNKQWDDAQHYINDYLTEIRKAQGSLNNLDYQHSDLDNEFTRMAGEINDMNRLLEETRKKEDEKDRVEAEQHLAIYQAETNEMMNDFNKEKKKFNETGNVEEFNSMINNNAKSIQTRLLYMSNTNKQIRDNANKIKMLEEQDSFIQRELASWNAIYNTYYQRVTADKINKDLKKILNIMTEGLEQEHSRFVASGGKEAEETPEDKADKAEYLKKRVKTPEELKKAGAPLVKSTEGKPKAEPLTPPPILTKDKETPKEEEKKEEEKKDSDEE